MQSAYWLFLLLAVLVLVFPLHISVKLSYDVFKNRGVLGFRLFFFKVWYSSFVVEGFGITLTTRDKKRKQLSVQVSRKDIIYIQRLMAQFRDKLLVKTMAIHTRIGLETPFASAMLAGAVQTVAGSVLAFVKNFKQSGNLKIKTKTEWQKKMARFRVDFVVRISLLDLIYCFLFAFIHTRRTILHEQIFKRKFSRRAFGFKH